MTLLSTFNDATNMGLLIGGIAALLLARAFTRDVSGPSADRGRAYLATRPTMSREQVEAQADAVLGFVVLAVSFAVQLYGNIAPGAGGGWIALFGVALMAVLHFGLRDRKSDAPQAVADVAPAPSFQKRRRNGPYIYPAETQLSVN